jgi:hypothetical protein
MVIHRQIPKAERFEDIPNISNIPHEVAFISERCLYTCCSAPECKALHVLMCREAEPYLAAATFSVEMLEEMLHTAKLIVAHKEKGAN